jgi:hypothetical protein
MWECPYNKSVECSFRKCDRCGWNPEVAEQRRKEFMSKLYKIPFTGYCEVYANSAEEAAEKAEDIQQQFFAHYDYGDPVCLGKEEENELD